MKLIVLCDTEEHTLKVEALNNHQRTALSITALFLVPKRTLSSQAKPKPSRGLGDGGWGFRSTGCPQRGRVRDACFCLEAPKRHAPFLRQNTNTRVFVFIRYLVLYQIKCGLRLKSLR